MGLDGSLKKTKNHQSFIVYKTKLNKDGSSNKNKSWLMVKRYKQEYGVDYKELFAPIFHLHTI